MNIINNQNLNAYIDEIADRLDWSVSDHSEIYFEVAQSKNIINALDIIELRVKPWFIRNGWMHQNWREMISTAINKLSALNFNLPDMRDINNLNDVVEVLRRLGQIKQVKSGYDNYVAPSKILNFFFPGLIPKIDITWIKQVCLRKANSDLFGWKRFALSGFVDLFQFKEYMQFGAEQIYENSVLENLQKSIRVKDAFAVAFEYCLLGYSKQEIFVALTDSKQQLGRQTYSLNKIRFHESVKKISCYSIDYHRNWLVHHRLRLIFDKMSEDVKRIGYGIEEKPTSQYIGYKIKGRLFAWIKVYRTNIEVGTYVIDKDNYRTEERMRVMSEADDYSTILEGMKSYYKYLGGE